MGLHARQKVWRVLRLLLVALLAGELFARLVLGLGHPPLLTNDPDVEYRYQANQDLYRFHNHIKFNAWSMRSDDFPKHKTNPREFRVLVLGDSVVNGGMRLDQSQIATEQLKVMLTRQLRRPVIVGNISAGSWGIPNLLAYIKRWGLFDADALVLVVNSDDATDLLGHGHPVGTRADMPDHPPLLALIEGYQRYLRRYLPLWLGGYPKRKKKHLAASADHANNVKIQQVITALTELTQRVRDHHIRMFFVQHLTREEVTTAPKRGHAVLKQAAMALQFKPIQLGPALKQSLEAGQNPYQDNTHFNEVGHRIMAQVIFHALIETTPHQPSANHTPQKTFLKITTPSRQIASAIRRRLTKLFFKVAGKYRNLGKNIKLRHLSKECQALLENAGDLIEVDLVADPDYHLPSNSL